jgi:hypothetical protein
MTMATLSGHAFDGCAVHALGEKPCVNYSTNPSRISGVQQVLVPPSPRLQGMKKCRGTLAYARGSEGCSCFETVTEPRAEASVRHHFFTDPSATGTFRVVSHAWGSAAKCLISTSQPV